PRARRPVPPAAAVGVAGPGLARAQERARAPARTGRAARAAQVPRLVRGRPEIGYAAVPLGEGRRRAARGRTAARYGRAPRAAAGAGRAPAAWRAHGPGGARRRLPRGCL